MPEGLPISSTISEGSVGRVSQPAVRARPLLIPTHFVHSFRRKPSTHSDTFRPC